MTVHRADLIKRCVDCLQLLVRLRSIPFPLPESTPTPDNSGSTDPLLLTGPPLPLLLTGPPPPQPRIRTQRQANTDLSFRRFILDQLDGYFTYIQRMRKVDPQSYKLYAKLGARVIPYVNDWSDINHALDPWFTHTLPGFGAVVQFTGRAIEELEDEEYKTDPKNAKIHSRFIHFTKYEQPPSRIQRTSDAVYNVVVYFDKVGDKNWDKHRGGRIEFPVCIRPSGAVELIRTRNQSWQTIRHKRGGGSSSFGRTAWEFPPSLVWWASQHKKDPQEFAQRVFTAAANGWQGSNASMLRVVAKKHNVVAVFSFDITTTPQFFRDRDDTVLTKSGQRARIFHIVRAHTRTRSGKQLNIKTHFSGLRHFTWNGYEVNITVPGWHHQDVDDFPIGAIDEEWRNKTSKRLVGIEWLGKEFAREVNV